VPIAITASLPSYNISNGLFSFLSPPINPDYTTAANPPQTLPASSCLAALSLPSVAGVGTATGALSASPAGNVCSGIYVVAATAGGTFSSNSTFVVVPPQALMQGMYGEAHGQVTQYGFNDPDEQALGLRFGTGWATPDSPDSMRPIRPLSCPVKSTGLIPRGRPGQIRTARRRRS